VSARIECSGVGARRCSPLAVAIPVTPVPAS
jgi:hypothetical protein